ncbi:hypothetical protein MYP_3370 [Sporocytophaga myxococcoides]|uniref:Uncharacterized protein n=1 Tax=Sporocytophaga myxococcoides TaxID=153721 RepID=A0A098LGM4_9BACT|nr:hypothetical protein [Sporocytophaga myxococcoides]GAL86141.1 hypothetical protein MYP_3370 [Sporocytophaga myxococcoides]
MQDFIDQAIKNGVTVSDMGPCQFCGGDYQKGIFDCMDNYNNGLVLIDFNNPKNHLSRPEPLKRGNITTKDLTNSTTVDECIELIKKWADEVYNAWRLSHPLVIQIADGFINKILNKKTYDRN